MLFRSFFSLFVYTLLLIYFSFSYSGEIRMLPYIGIGSTYMKYVDSSFDDVCFNYQVGLKLNEFINIDFEYIFHSKTCFYYYPQNNHCKEVLDTQNSSYFIDLNFNKTVGKYTDVFLLSGLGFVEQRNSFLGVDRLGDIPNLKIQNLYYCSGFGVKYILTPNVDLYITYKLKNKITGNIFKNNTNFVHLCSFGYIYFL